MGKAASTTLKPSDVNTDGQNQVLQITIKRGKDDTSRAKPLPSLQLEVDLGDIVSPCIDVMFICSEWGSKKGGLSTFNRELAVNLANISNGRIKVHCYVSESSEAERQDASRKGVNLITAKRSPGSSDPLDWLKTPPSDRLNPDVVVSHGRKFGSAAYFIQMITNCRWIHFVHVNCEALGKHKLECSVTADAIADNEEKNRQELELCRASELVVAVGTLLQRKYQRSLPDIKVEVITPGIFEEYINPAATQPERELSEEDFSIFMFGRGSFEDFSLKGYDIVGKAVASLERKFELTFVGAAQDEQRKIETWFLEETKISRNQLTIRGLCSYEQIKTMLREADLVVMPSRTEGFGLVALEAISAGVSVLVSSETGIAKALQDLENGMSVVVKTDVSDEWANRIFRLSEQTRRDRHITALRLREQYKLKYSWEKECKKFEKMILELVKITDQNEIPLNLRLTDNTTLKDALKAVLKVDDVQSPKSEDGELLNADPNILNKKTERTERRKEGEKSTDPGTSDKKAKQINSSRQRVKQADRDTSNKKAEKTTERKTAPGTPNETKEQIQEDKEVVQAAGDAYVNQDMEESVVLLFSAASEDDVAEIESLLSRGICINSRDSQGWTPVMIAAGNGKIQAVKYLISRGADLGLRDNNGRNSLHWASLCGDVVVIQLLVSHMTDIDPRTATGRTPLMLAAENGKVQAVRCLIKKGANPALRHRTGWNSLHIASRYGHVDVIELLVSHMTDIDSEDAWGWTPLMIAAEYGKVQAVKCLISKGADLALRHRTGWNSLHFASLRGHVDVIEQLVSRMTDLD